MDIATLKEKLLETIDSIDEDKLSLTDLRLYVDILKAASEIQVKSYADTMAEIMNGFQTPVLAPAAIGSMKGDA